MKVAIVGCGGLGSAIIRGLLVPSGFEFELLVFDHDKEKSLEVMGLNPKRIVACDDVKSAVKNADVIIIAVKPKDVKSACKSIGNAFRPQSLVVSCATGITLEALVNYLGGHSVVARAMPNTAVAVLGSTTGVLLGEGCDKERDQEKLEMIFKQLGDIKIVSSEHDLHAVTALSGSGPAFVLTMLESMIDAGIRAGLSRPLAEFFAKGALKAAHGLVSQSSASVYDLKGQITSPAGTTIEGIYALEQAGFRHAVMDAIDAAHMRSVELSELENDLES